MTREWAIWEDHANRFSPLKAVALLVLVWPGALLLARYGMNDLGGRPITQLIHGTGDWTVRFLLATLAVTPLRAVWDWSRVLLLRRMLGVGTACYAVAHFVLFWIDSKWRVGFVLSEIALRFYLTIGFVALCGLVALAVTSTDGWQKSLGRRWKTLHKLIFLLTALALFHYFLQSKADVTDAVFATGVFTWLGFWRLAPRRWQNKLVLPLGLAAAAPLATALVEASWYGLATGVKAGRVLWANLDFDPSSLRPSGNVLVLALAVLALAGIRRLWKRRARTPVGARRPA